MVERILFFRAPTCEWKKIPHLSDLEYTLDFCVPLLDTFSHSKVPFLSDDLSVQEEQQTKWHEESVCLVYSFTMVSMKGKWQFYSTVLHHSNSLHFESQMNIMFACCQLRQCVTVSCRLLGDLPINIILIFNGIYSPRQLTLIRKNPAMSFSDMQNKLKPIMTKNKNKHAQ